MKNLIKLFIVLFITCFLYSCNDGHSLYHNINTVDIESIQKNYKIITIDSCEYIVYDEYDGYYAYGYMAHKGNCKYCEKRLKQTLESINLKNE